MNKHLILSALLCLAALSLSAGNSIFSYGGYPVQYFGNDIYSLGMGDAGASDIFRNNTGYGNPAMHSLSNRSLFSTGLLMGYNRYRSRDASGKEYSFLDNSLDFPYFSLSIPVRKHRVGFQFHSYASGVVANKHEANDIVETQSMDRYLFRGDLIYSYGWEGYQVGLSGNYYFGHEDRMFAQETPGAYFNTREDLSRAYSNPSFTVGALKYYDKLSFGAHFSKGCTLSGEEVRASIHEEEHTGDYQYKLPDKISLSATQLVTPELKVAADLNYELWSAIGDADYDNGWKVALGAAYEPKPDQGKQVFLRVPLRTGLSYRHLPFKTNAAEINELALSLGLSLNFKDSVNRIDIGLQYLKRGGLETNKLTEDSFMLMFGFTGFDIITKASDRTAPRDIPQKEDLAQ